MRTTIDLPPGLLEQIRVIADEHGQSMTSAVTGLLANAVAAARPEPMIARSAATGLPVISTGRPVTCQEVADLIDDDE